MRVNVNPVGTITVWILSQLCLLWVQISPNLNCLYPSIVCCQDIVCHVWFSWVCFWSFVSYVNLKAPIQSVCHIDFKLHWLALAGCMDITMITKILMMTSSNENISALLALCEGIHRSSVNCSDKGQRFDIFFDLRLNKRLSKHSRRRWFELPSCSLWCHGNVTYHSKGEAKQRFCAILDTVCVTQWWK